MSKESENLNTNQAQKRRKSRPYVKRDSFKTHDGHRLTSTEALFIDKYVETGNGRLSYMEAYPNSNPSSAAQLAHRVLKKDYIASEINFRLEQSKNESIANAQEIMQYFTDVMRGNIKDQFGLDASLGERTKAAQELAKRQIDIPNKLAGNEAPQVTIKLDWARPRNESNETPSASMMD